MSLILSEWVLPIFFMDIQWMCLLLLLWCVHMCFTVTAFWIVKVVTSSRSLVSPPLRRSKSCLLFVSPSAHSTFLCTLTLTLGSHVTRQLESNSVAAAFIPNSDFLRATYFQQQYVVRSSLPWKTLYWILAFKLELNLSLSLWSLKNIQRYWKF